MAEVSGRHRLPQRSFRDQRLLLAVALGAGLGAWFAPASALPVAVPVAPATPAVASAVPPVPRPPINQRSSAAEATALAVSKKPKRVPPLTGTVGLTGPASVLAKYIQNAHPDVASISGVRPDPLPDHPSGRALDVMVYSDKKTGDAVLRDVLKQSQRFGVRYAIWRQQMYRPNGYVGWMGNRGTPTLNHYDHVHITVW